ncbi:MAG: hypothetical protein Q8O94_02975 [bacterium]|nr:hypothetical protein [bacterium]
MNMETHYYWFSFVDTGKPRDERSVVVSVVEGHSFEEVTEKAKSLKCWVHDVEGYQDRLMHKLISSSNMNRILDSEEAEQVIDSARDAHATINNLIATMVDKWTDAYMSLQGIADDGDENKRLAMGFAAFVSAIPMTFNMDDPRGTPLIKTMESLIAEAEENFHKSETEYANRKDHKC